MFRFYSADPTLRFWFFFNLCLTGSEYDYVVLSTVRSVPRSQVERQPTNDWLERHLGVTADGHQINVAFTRARKGLILTGQCNQLPVHDFQNVHCIILLYLII